MTRDDINTQTVGVVFETDLGPVQIASDILEKYNLKESSKEACQKIDEGKEPRVIIIIQAVKDLFLGKISEEDFVFNIEKQLEISKETAKKIAEDAKEKLLSIAKKIIETEVNAPKEKPIIATTIKPPIEIEHEKIIKEGIIKPDLKTIQQTKKFSVPEKSKEAKKIPKKADIYREPIE